MKVFGLLLVVVILIASGEGITGQLYSYSCTGNCASLKPNVKGKGGWLIAGGGEDVDAAFAWWLPRASGGDVVILRTAGTGAYNPYLFDFGGVNSVSTFVLQEPGACFDSYVLQRVSTASALFWAGGDQWSYYSYVKDTPLYQAILQALQGNQAPYGGTSAGAMIQPFFLFSAQFDTVSSSTALRDPYDHTITIGSDFMQTTPFFSNVLVDTHYSARDRAGRALTFLARLFTDVDTRNPLVIAANEQSALMVYPDGRAFLAAGASHSAVYFLTLAAGKAITCQPNRDLALTADVIKAASNMTVFYDFSSSSVINEAAVSRYQLTAAKGKVTSSNGSVY